MPNQALTLLLEFDDQVRRDHHQPPAFLHRRDRRFALEATEPHTPRAWLDHIQRLSGGHTNAALKPLRRWRRITLGFAVTGTVLGIVTMLGLLYYDGSGRINVTVMLGFMLLQLMLALATSLQALVGWRPWGWLIERYLHPAEESAMAINRLQPQLMARAAHCGGLMFALAGLLTLLTLVVVRDLAFGWSTTLSTGADSYYRFVATLAWPWHTLWPAAVPDLELVSQTRFFRIEADTAVTAGRWGEWWPFVTLAWCCYVILPRLILTALSSLHLRLRARHVLTSHPGLLALRYRMETPEVDTGHQNTDVNVTPELAVNARLHPLPDSPVVVRWAGAGEASVPAQFQGHQQRLVVEAGGAASLAQDQTAIAEAGRHLSDDSRHSVTLLARAWEPPTAELEDFITDARSHWPANTRITLVPLATDPNQPASDQQLAPWLRFCERLADKRLYVARYSNVDATTGNGEALS
ncbi:DUF2868 domain-containing protein [Marinobacter zhejiangensis]|uniref:DUF2868 domain-containing protein n=1 Tax=Marinobacter zhejiangensis TaxID=488535 RepID=A0A1I4LUF4_9GAMM|nr:DUF2868 domain-containing protein [Marinobacter zhejiangensis]SFL94569.1 Protein of unknown function [Marinobacter zhejiangensis]